MSINVRSNEPAPVTEVAKPTESTEAVVEKTAPEATESKATEQKETPTESETVETEVEEGDEPKTESKEAETEVEAKDKTGKKKGGFQRRIDKLNARVSAKEQELNYWKERAMENPAESTNKPKVELKAVEGKPDPNKFDTHTEYVEALTDWKTEQKFKEREQKAEQSKILESQQKLANTYSERAKEFAAKTADFDEVVSDVDDIKMSPVVRDILLNAENGPELAYELAKDRAEFERLNKLPPLAAAREMGRFESRLTPKQSEKVEPKKLSLAPKPLAPVGTGGKNSAPKSLSDPTLSQTEYERLRNEQIKKRRQA